MVIWARKLYRIFFGFIFLVVYYFSPYKWIALIVVGVFLIPLLLLEWARHKYPGFWPYLMGVTGAKKWYIKVSKRIFKITPGKVMPDTWFLSGIFISIAVFSKSIAVCVLLFSIFGDAISAIVGTKYGTIKLIGKRSVQGSLAHLAICVLIGVALITVVEVPFLLILIGAVVATVAEFAPIPVDDNLAVPLITGIVMELTKLLI